MSQDVQNLTPVPGGSEGLPNRQSKTDPIFDSVYESLVEQQHLSTEGEEKAPAPGREGRVACRRTYECQQFIAEFDGMHLPAQEDFKLVMCHDISATGFSYWSMERPSEKSVVVMLGTIPFIFMHARVANIRKDLQRSYRGWRIGCEFVKRVGI